MILNQPEITNSRHSLTALILAACVRSKESLYIPVTMPDNLEPILLLRSVADQHQKQKDVNLGLTLRPPLLNKTRNLSPCHFTTLSPFPPCHLTTLPPFLTLSPHYPPTSPTLPPYYRPTFLTLPPHYPPTFSTFSAHYPSTFPTFSAHYPLTFPSAPPSQRLIDHSKITFFH